MGRDATEGRKRRPGPARAARSRLLAAAITLRFVTEKVFLPPPPRILGVHTGSLRYEKNTTPLPPYCPLVQRSLPRPTLQAQILKQKQIQKTPTPQASRVRYLRPLERVQKANAELLATPRTKRPRGTHTVCEKQTDARTIYLRIK